jgi:hypothetical protein
VTEVSCTWNAVGIRLAGGVEEFFGDLSLRKEISYFLSAGSPERFQTLPLDPPESDRLDFALVVVPGGLFDIKSGQHEPLNVGGYLEDEDCSL